jgi:hypothetical protein
MLIELLEYSLPALSLGVATRFVPFIRGRGSKELPANVFKYRIKEKKPPYTPAYKYILCPACDEKHDPDRMLGHYCECLENTAEPHIHGKCLVCQYEFAMLTKMYNNK